MSKATHTRSTTTPAPATRRSVLTKGLAAAAVFGTLPAAAGEPDDPVLPVYREWMAGRRDYLRAVGQAEEDAATAREFAAERTIAGLTPTTMAGFAAVAHLLWDRFGQDSDDVGAGLILAVWRAAGGIGEAPPDISEI